MLVEGEAGAGKTVAARRIHDQSPRAGRPFASLDCEALDPARVDAALFGETGTRRRGLLAEADGGTLLVENVGAATPALQIRLVRLLQDREADPPGRGMPRKVDLRLIAATRDDLAAAVRAGRFREDLLVRLGVVRIVMPPLRARREDLPFLVAEFVRAANAAHHRRVTGVTPGVLDRLMEHEWPGNVGELEAAIEAMVALVPGRRALEVSDLPRALRHGEGDPDPDITVGTTVAEAERRLIEATLRHTGQDKRRAAALLGIGLRTLYRKMGGPRRRIRAAAKLGRRPRR